MLKVFLLSFLFIIIYKFIKLKFMRYLFLKLENLINVQLLDLYFLVVVIQFFLVFRYLIKVVVLKIFILRVGIWGREQVRIQIGLFIVGQRNRFIFRRCFFLILIFENFLYIQIQFFFRVYLFYRICLRQMREVGFYEIFVKLWVYRRVYEEKN